MKTTIEIADELLLQAHKLAERENVSINSLVESGLRMALCEHEKMSSFKLRDASVGGEGLHPETQGLDWDGLRDMIYEDRG